MAIYTINDYRNAIRERIRHLKLLKNTQRIIIWDVRADESIDASLLSFRAYGTRLHTDVVLVACGASGIWERLPLKRIVLPQLADVLQLRKQYLGEG